VNVTWSPTFTVTAFGVNRFDPLTVATDALAALALPWVNSSPVITRASNRLAADAAQIFPCATIRMDISLSLLAGRLPWVKAHWSEIRRETRPQIRRGGEKRKS